MARWIEEIVKHTAASKKVYMSEETMFPRML